MPASQPLADARPTPTILGVGAALPDQLITNADLEARLDTSDEWIVRRTGIRERHHLRESETLAAARRGRGHRTSAHSIFARKRATFDTSRGTVKWAAANSGDQSARVERPGCR